MSFFTSIFDRIIIYVANRVPHCTSFALYSCFHNKCYFTFSSNLDSETCEVVVSYEIWRASCLDIGTSALDYLCVRATHGLLFIHSRRLVDNSCFFKGSVFTQQSNLCIIISVLIWYAHVVEW